MKSEMSFDEALKILSVVAKFVYTDDNFSPNATMGEVRQELFKIISKEEVEQATAVLRKESSTIED